MQYRVLEVEDSGIVIRTKRSGLGRLIGLITDYLLLVTSRVIDLK